MTIDSLLSTSSIAPLGIVKKTPGTMHSIDGSDDFSAVLVNLAREAAANIKAAEKTSMQGIQGSVPMQDVVQSVLKAQTSLQTVLALRDKAVTAYQSITSMPI
jgi:flagellar hook-basal body complex protein FliE